jgi:serine/alanine adding enzyme
MQCEPSARGQSTQITHWEPPAEQEWSAVIQGIHHANLAQLPQWWTVIKQAYSHVPLYLKAEDDEGRMAVLPAFLISSRWFGTVVTSMPFLDAGGPCSPSNELARELVDALMVEAKRHGAVLLELRCSVEIDLPCSALQDKVNLVLPLPSDPECLWQRVGAKVRNQVRKAERSGLTAEFGGVEKLDDFYDIFAVNMRDLGSPVHSRRFFQAIFATFAEKARVVLVRKGVRPIGGLIALSFKDDLVVPWASSLRQYFSLCPNMLLYWETLRAACTEGFRRFDFGRSSRNASTYRFKRQWGAAEEPLYWYSIPLVPNHRPRFSGTGTQRAAFAQLWKHLPVGVTQWLGPYIRKYLTL